MPYYKKRTTRPRRFVTRRPRRYVRRTARVYRRPRQVIQRFTRRTDQFYDVVSRTPGLANLSCGATNFNFVLMNWTLDSLPNDTEFTKLFQYYMITRVTCTFILDKPNQNSATGPLPTLMVSWAPDDDTVPATLQEMRERGNCKVIPFSDKKRSMSFTYRPIYSTFTQDLVGTSIVTPHKGWISCEDDKVLHQGLLVGIDNIAGSEDVVIKTEFKYWLATKQTK